MMNKMKNLIKSTFLALLFGLGLSLVLQSCGNNEPGLAKVNLKMEAVTVLSTVNPGGRVAETGLVFTDVILGVTEIEFETLEEESHEHSSDIEDSDDDGEDDNEEIEFEGHFVVDLIAGTSTPDFGVAEITPGIYEELEIDLRPILDGDITMFVAFEFTPDGASEPVKYEYTNRAEMEYEIEEEGGFQLDEGALNQMLIVIDLDAMFAGLNLNTANADADGIVRINGESNADLAAQIAQNLGEVMDGGEDEDGDGEFDDD